MLEEAYKATKETIVERLTSPLISSFVIAWLLWNYKFVMLVLSANGVLVTLELIELIAFPDFWTTAWLGVAAPLLSALAYVLVYPWPSRWIYQYTLDQQRRNNAIKTKIEGATPLTLEESKKIRTAFTNERQSWDSERARLEDDLSTARKAAKTAEEDALSMEGKKEREISELQKRVAEMDRRLSEAADSAARERAAAAERMKRMQLELDIFGGVQLSIEQRMVLETLDSFEGVRTPFRGVARKIDWGVRETYRVLQDLKSLGFVIQSQKGFLLSQAGSAAINSYNHPDRKLKDEQRRQTNIVNSPLSL